jgi:hypothetical protein
VPIAELETADPTAVAPERPETVLKHELRTFFGGPLFPAAPVRSPPSARYATVVTTSSCSLHRLLLEPTYWQGRLAEIAEIPRQLLVFPRHDLSWPGGEVAELWLRGAQGGRVRTLFARPRFAAQRPTLRLVHAESEGLAPADGSGWSGGVFHWDRIRDGESWLIWRPDPSRRLEDRVLDLVRTVQAARQLLGDLEAPVEFEDGDGPGADELRIAQQLLREQWV